MAAPQANSRLGEGDGAGAPQSQVPAQQPQQQVQAPSGLGAPAADPMASLLGVFQAQAARQDAILARIIDRQDREELRLEAEQERLKRKAVSWSSKRNEREAAKFQAHLPGAARRRGD